MILTDTIYLMIIQKDKARCEGLRFTLKDALAMADVVDEPDSNIEHLAERIHRLPNDMVHAKFAVMFNMVVKTLSVGEILRGTDNCFVMYLNRTKDSLSCEVGSSQVENGHDFQMLSLFLYSKIKEKPDMVVKAMIDMILSN